MSVWLLLTCVVLVGPAGPPYALWLILYAMEVEVNASRMKRESCCRTRSAQHEERTMEQRARSSR